MNRAANALPSAILQAVVGGRSRSDADTIRLLTTDPMTRSHNSKGGGGYPLVARTHSMFVLIYPIGSICALLVLSARRASGRGVPREAEPDSDSAAAPIDGGLRGTPISSRASDYAKV
jgi:hypothetical protein